MNGEVSFNGEAAKQSDFVQITEQTTIDLNAPAGARVFVIASPVHPGYRTYGELEG